MTTPYNPQRKVITSYGKSVIPLKQVTDFNYLINNKVSDIILFDDGNNDMIAQGVIVLPRHFYIFVGTKDGELQLKPYEYDQYRIVVTTYKDIIMSVDSIG